MPGSRAGRLWAQAKRRRGEEHVLGDGEHRHQHEVLVHHPHARSDGLRRRVDGRRAVEDLAGDAPAADVAPRRGGRLLAAVDALLEEVSAADTAEGKRGRDEMIHRDDLVLLQAAGPSPIDTNGETTA